MTDTQQRPISVGFISLGCAKNTVDSQFMAGVLLKGGLSLAARPEEADVLVVNTCAFIDAARRESIDEIRSACRLKKRGKCRAVIVAGCLPQRYRDNIASRLPDVDAFIGLDSMDLAAEVARRVLAGEGGVSEISGRAERLYEPALPGVVFSGGCYAYLKIGEGCNHGCSFCAIPGIRGRQRSRTVASLAREAEDLLSRGTRELVLVAQDVTAYGTDLNNGTSLAVLLKSLGGFGGKYWLRWLYGYPTRIADELMDAMADSPPVCHYFDVPVQHSHPEILRMMKRGSTAGAVARMAGRIRSRFPDAAVRTTCLLGFPGEQAEHVDHLVDYIRRSEFDHLGAFVYSPEDGTPAACLPGRPSRVVAERRRGRIMSVQKEIVRRRLAARIGSVEEVLLESRQPGVDNAWVGRSRRLAPEVDGRILVEGVRSGEGKGDFVPALITGATGYDLRGVRACGKR